MTSMPTESSASEPRPRSRLRLQHRIVLSVVLVALVTSGGAAWFAVSVTTGALQSRLQAQLVGSADAVGRGGFALNPTILGSLRDIVGAQIVTLGPDGGVVASSDAAPPDGLVAAARREASGAPRAGEPARAVLTDCGFPCMVAVQQVDGRPGTAVVLVAEMSALNAASRSVARAILLSAVLSVVLLILASQVVVTRLTGPLDRLVRFVRELSPLDARRRAPVGDDEVGELSEAFNGMLDRLDQSRAALVRSEKLGLAGLFAARVAHDVRNPLSSIKMQTQLLRSLHQDDADDRSATTSILKDVEQVESVVRDLMELANPGAMRLEEGAINDVVDDAVRQLAAQLAYRKITLDVRLAEGLPAVPLDRSRLKQAFLNLMVNAAEAMHTGGQMTVTSGLEGDAIWVRICDDGVGVDPALVERAFDPFVSTKPEGVGLGLVNVKSVVDGHGGRISLEPRDPRGTCAQVWLPRTQHAYV
jgi:signal transduction histidine kinase